jgi:hypothetical protein
MGECWSCAFDPHSGSCPQRIRVHISDSVLNGGPARHGTRAPSGRSRRNTGDFRFEFPLPALALVRSFVPFLVRRFCSERRSGWKHDGNWNVWTGVDLDPSIFQENANFILEHLNVKCVRVPIGTPQNVGNSLIDQAKFSCIQSVIPFFPSRRRKDRQVIPNSTDPLV